MLVTSLLSWQAARKTWSSSLTDQNPNPATLWAGFSGFATTLRNKQTRLSFGVAEKWDDIDANLILANEMALACLGSILSRAGLVSCLEINDSDRHRAAIHADFVKGLQAVEFCLERGLYSQAATLVRREMEAVNNLIAHRKGKQKDKRNPKNNPFPQLSQIYKSLSGIAHNADRIAMAYLAGGSPADTDPRFDQGFCEHLLETHVHCMVAVCLDLVETIPSTTPERFNRDEEYYLQVTLGILVDRGFIIEKGENAPPP